METLKFILGYYNPFRKRDKVLEKKITQMLVIGFWPYITFGTVLRSFSKGMLSGVILFSRNIKNPKQLKKLTDRILKNNKDIPPFIMTDQEGGYVARLNRHNGFYTPPSAEKLRKETENPDEIYKVYDDMAKELIKMGINFNLGPCVDLGINKDSRLSKHRRAYSENPEIVHKYAKEFIKAHYANKIIPTLKHFPGLGSTNLDSHDFLPDITETWDEKELEPFKSLINEFPEISVMTAHVKNNKLDTEEITPFSSKILSKLTEYNHNGLVIMDAPNMNALAKYKIDEILIKAINAGINLFIFPNHVPFAISPKWYMQPERFIYIILKAIEKGEITVEKIEESYQKIIKIKEQLK